MGHADIDLVRKAGLGDRAALEELVKSTISNLRVFLLSISPPGTSVDDLVQETYLTAYTNLTKFDPSGAGAFSSWLCAIGRNLLKRELRNRAYEARARDALHGNAEGQVWEKVVEMPADFVRLRTERLRMCLKKLPDQQRELITLRYGRELAYERIGQMLGRSAGWARTTLFRARQLLRRCVDRGEEVRRA